MLMRATTPMAANSAYVLPRPMPVCRLGKAKDTSQLLLKFVRVATAAAWPRTASGKISPTSSQEMGPKLICKITQQLNQLAYHRGLVEKVREAAPLAEHALC